MADRTLRCHLFGCSWRFATEGPRLVWICERCGREGGAREYASVRDARRYAAALNRRRPGPPTSFLAALSGTALTRRPPRERR